MSRHFTLNHNSLTFDARRDIIEDLKQDIVSEYEAEAKDFLRADLNLPEEKRQYFGKTWQEIICKEYAIDWELWQNPEKEKVFNWDFSVDQKAEEQAEEFLDRTLNKTVLEVFLA